MTRREKYPDTDTFRFYNANAKNKITTDCVIRALSTALEQDWKDTLLEITEYGIKKGLVFDDPKCYAGYLAEKGWIKCPRPKKKDGTKYTGKEFCKTHKDSERCIANIGGHHVIAIIGHKVHDIWDSTNKCIGNYWKKVS